MCPRTRVRETAKEVVFQSTKIRRSTSRRGEESRLTFPENPESLSRVIKLDTESMILCPRFGTEKYFT